MLVGSSSKVSDACAPNHLSQENLNWNSSKLLDEDRITSNLVSELFNKPFELFENNRELLDNLAYFILCQETIIL
jgi:hypothetical protein